MQHDNGGKIVLWSGMDKTNGQTIVGGHFNAESKGALGRLPVAPHGILDMPFTGLELLPGRIGASS